MGGMGGMGMNDANLEDMMAKMGGAGGAGFDPGEMPDSDSDDEGMCLSIMNEMCFVLND